MQFRIIPYVYYEVKVIEILIVVRYASKIPVSVPELFRLCDLENHSVGITL